MPPRRFSEEDYTKTKTDKRDMKILALLSENSRRPLNDIAKRVRIRADTVRYRIHRLESKGVIQKYIPIINFKRLNYYVYHLFLLMDERHKEEKKRLVTELMHHDNVLSVVEYSDRWDYEVTLLARNQIDFDNIITDIVSRYPELILDRNKLETIRNYTMLHFPTVPAKHPVEPQRESIKCDALDMKLLSVLAEDSSVSTYELGRRLGVSSDTVSYRIKKLIRAGIILKFTVLVNLSLLGYRWYTYCVRVRMLDHAHESKFSEFARKFPNILRACKTLGDWELYLYIVSENPRQFHTTIKEIKEEFSDIITNYQTWIGYKEHMYNAFPRINLKQ